MVMKYLKYNFIFDPFWILTLNDALWVACKRHIPHMCPSSAHSKLGRDTTYTHCGISRWFSGSPSHSWDSTLHSITAASFHTLSNSLFMNDPTIRRRIAVTNKSIVQYTTQRGPQNVLMGYTTLQSGRWLPTTSTLKMKAVCSYEILVPIYKKTER
jgi:hypothetical protein